MNQSYNRAILKWLGVLSACAMLTKVVAQSGPKSLEIIVWFRSYCIVPVKLQSSPVRFVADVISFEEAK